MPLNNPSSDKSSINKSSINKSSIHQTSIRKVGIDKTATSQTGIANNRTNDNTHSETKDHIPREMIDTTPVLSAMTRWKRAGNQYVQASSQSTLEYDSSRRILVKQKKSSLRFEMLYGVIGVVVVIFSFYIWETDPDLMLFHILPVVGIGIWMIVEAVRFKLKKYPNFDKDIGWFWVGDSEIYSITELQSIPERDRLSNIVAVQMIGASMFNGATLGNWENYHLYELNIVFDDLQRCNIQCHANMSEMSQNGRMLAKFLDVPFY